MALDFPLSEQDKGSIEQADFAQIKAREFKGGLPVFSAVPTHEGKNGEIVLYDSGSTYALYYYLNGGWRTVTVDTTTFTELWSDGHPASTTNWEDWDISALVPAGTIAVEVQMYNGENNSNLGMGARKNGSSVDRQEGILAYGRTYMTVEVGADRIIEIYTSDKDNTGFRLTGYWS